MTDNPELVTEEDEITEEVVNEEPQAHFEVPRHTDQFVPQKTPFAQYEE